VLKGKMEDVNAVTVQQLMAKINVEDLDEGTHSVPLNITLNGNITQVGETEVSVKISKVKEATTDEQQQ